MRSNKFVIYSLRRGRRGLAIELDKDSLSPLEEALEFVVNREYLWRVRAVQRDILERYANDSGEDYVAGELPSELEGLLDNEPDEPS